ncbi:MAG: hypothetical protein PHQ23_07480 [Candidatus Wallbacteria bacterium]|nr:hypothetical protein [Candidatus Wallbacteria bacterium]
MKRFLCFAVITLLWCVQGRADQCSNARGLNHFAGIIDPELSPIIESEFLTREELAFYFLKLFYQKSQSPFDIWSDISADERDDLLRLYGDLEDEIVRQAGEYNVNITDLWIEYRKFDAEGDVPPPPRYILESTVANISHSGSAYRRIHGSEAAVIGAFSGDVKTGTTSVRFRAGYDSSLLYAYERCRPELLQIESSGRNWSVSLFDQLAPDTDFGFSGALFRLADNRYTAEVYFGRGNSQITSIGQDLLTGGGFLSHESGPHYCSFRASAYHNKEQQYFRRNNKDVEEFAVIYRFDEPGFFADLELGQTRSRKFGFGTADEGFKPFFEAALEWERERWDTTLRLLHASSDVQRQSGSDVRDEDSVTLDYRFFVDETCKVSAGLFGSSYPSATDNLLQYHVAGEKYFDTVYPTFWRMEYIRKRIDGEVYSCDEKDLSWIFRLDADSNQYQADLSLEDRDTVPAYGAGYLLRSLQLRNTHFFTPEFWSEHTLRGEKDNDYSLFGASSEWCIRNRRTVYSLSLEYYDREHDVPSYSNQMMSAVVSIGKRLNPDEHISFFLEDRNEDYQREDLNYRELRCDLKYTRNFR